MNVSENRLRKDCEENKMKQFTLKVPTPKRRNSLARAVLDPQGAFRARRERDRTVYSRKVKHKKSVDS